MIKKILLKSLVFIFIFSVSLEVTAQRKKRKKKKDAKVEVKKPAPKPKKGAIQPYKKVITKDAVTDKGLFDVHRIDEKYFYEIPDSIFDREMLMVTRIAKTAAGLGFGGGKVNTQVLRWQRKGKKIMLRVVSHNVHAADSLPVSEAVHNSNFEPVLYTFPIKAIGKDSITTVIEVTDLFGKDVKSLGLPQFYRSRYAASRLDGSKSFIETVKSYPLNIESRHVKTYFANKAPSNAGIGTLSVEMSNSMILLPKTPMKRRYFDERVGWFARGQTDYGLDVQKTKTVVYLDRWRLEVKDEDVEKFKKGILVEPKKQIVYYIDRATPKKWRKYLKAGIEDWQVAFEAAGFKNAIIAKDPPTKEEDPEWSPEDVRYSVVRYLASPIPNANGPHVSDPRSGEILESDINWYHNVMTLLQNWFFVQTAAINPDARSLNFKDETMGRLIRFVSSHEVGHTLGLPHNMGSSVAYPVDSLRSATFTKKYGTAPSIMDYARFNYIAQPEDKGVALMPNIGIYDKYSIAWGYKPILNTTAVDEKKTLDKWILAHENDPKYRFGRQQFGVVDPSSQTEDLGDDAVKASTYGIANLKRILPNLIEWTAEDGKNYADLKTMYNQVLGQYNRYMGHVVGNIGGVYENFKTYDQKGAVYTHVSKVNQKRAMKFLQNELFKTPTWLIDKNIFDKIESVGSVERLRSTQERTLNSLLDTRKMTRILENGALNTRNAYALIDMISDLRRGIWSEINTGKTIDIYRRNLQRSHLQKMDELMNKNNSSSLIRSDVRLIIREDLRTLKYLLKSGINKTPDRLSKLHLKDALVRVNLILDPK